MTKNNYIIEARCNGDKKFFTVHNATLAHLSRTATHVAKSLFYTDNINIIKYYYEN